MVRAAGIVCLILAGVLLAPPSRADEVENAAREALELYRQGDRAGAAAQFDYAAQLIRQAKGDDLARLLPAAIPGWTAEEASGQGAAGAFMGGGVHAERRYTKGDGEMTLSIMSDNPMIQGVMVMVQNPAMAGMSGARVQTVAGQRAMVQYDEAEKSGDISVVVDNRILVQLQGFGASREDMLAQLSKVDFAAIAKR